jgi:2-hydroxy-6-oxonona-2,4-dienedioate hydrolase
MPKTSPHIRRRCDLVRGLPMHSRYAVDKAPEGRTPVVLVHGLVISSAFLEPGLRELARDHPAYAPDLPGYGLSAKPPQQYRLERQADYLGAWMDEVGLEKAVVVGTSLGTQIVSFLAVRRPELVERAVLVSPTMDPDARSQLESLARWSRELPYEIGMIPIMLRDYARAGLRRAMHTFQMALEDKPEQRLEQMEMPTLVVRGELDPIVPQDWAEAVTEMLPDGRLQLVKGQPHALNFTAPREFAKLIREFAAEPAKRRRRRVAAA